MNNNIFDIDRVAELVDNTLITLNAKDIGSIRLRWSNRCTSCLGLAMRHSAKGNSIVLSAPLWPRATLIERDTTVVHEVCHLVANYKYGNVQSHGRQWKHLMRLCGYQNPQTCHRVDRTGLKRKQKRYVCYCKCSTHKVSPKKYHYMKSGNNLMCLKCRQILTILSDIPVDE